MWSMECIDIFDLCDPISPPPPFHLHVAMEIFIDLITKRKFSFLNDFINFQAFLECNYICIEPLSSLSRETSLVMVNGN